MPANLSQQKRSQQKTSQQQLGHYQLIKALGEGGMGIVYLAEDTRLRRMVAIKCLKPKHSDEHQGSHHKRLQREATTLAQLNHANVVQIYDIIEDEEQFALVMEYIDGNTLNKQLREHVVSVKQRLIWLQQIADGLAAAHGKGLIHRDLKADNVLINPDGIAKITDFGIAKNTRDEHTEATLTGKFIGSYSALSPEQALGLPLAASSDLFSFGILAFKLLCGRHPFGNTDNNNILVQNILHQQPLPANILNPDLDPALVELLNSLLAKKINLRPANASAISRQLQLAISQHADDNAEPTFSETLDLDLPQYSMEALYNTDNRAPAESIQHRPTTSKTTLATNIFNKARRIIANSLLLVVALAFSNASYWYWQQLQKPTPLYVAVLPPSLNANSPMAEQQQRLLLNTIETALQQTILDTSGLHLISPREVKNVKGNYQKIARTVSADVILESTLQCEINRCEINLSRIQPVDSDADTAPARWVMHQQQQWPVLMDYQYRNLATDLQHHLIRLFPQHSMIANEQALEISEADYQWFMALRHQVQNKGQDYPESLEFLLTKDEKFKSYSPYYSLLSYLSITLFDDTQNSMYLEKLRNKLKQSESIIGPNIPTLEQLLDIELRQHQFDQAKSLLPRMRDLGIDRVSMTKHQAQIAHYQGNYSKADKFYQQALTLQPSLALWYATAFNQWYSGDPNAAIASLEQLFKLEGNNYNASILLGSIYLTLGRLEEAIIQYNKVIIISGETQHFNNLGLAYELQGNYVKAKEAFSKAVELSPDHTTALLNLADSYFLNNQKVDANLIYKKILALTNDNKNWDSLRDRAQALIHLGETKSALKVVQKSLRTDGDNPEALFNAALIYSLAEQWLSSLIYIEKSLERGLSPIWFNLPWFNGLCSSEAAAMNELLAQQRCSVSN